MAIMKSDLISGTNKDQEVCLFGLDISATALRETQRECKSASIQEVSGVSSMKLVRMLKCTCVVHGTWTDWKDRVQNCCRFDVMNNYFK